MNKTLKWLTLSTLAIIGLLILSPIVFIGQIIYRVISSKYTLWYYFFAIAVGADALGGSFLYGSKRHTVSALTGYYANRKKTKWHIRQEKIIDYFFGKNHCYTEMLNEGL